MVRQTVPYAERLKAALEVGKAAGDGRPENKRQLAVAVAEYTGNKLDSERRSIYTYFDHTEPDPDRAALLAVIMRDPSLALVQPQAEKRKARHEELEARVAQLEEIVNRLSPQMKSLGDRVVALEQREPARPVRASK